MFHSIGNIAPSHDFGSNRAQGLECFLVTLSNARNAFNPFVKTNFFRKENWKAASNSFSVL